MTTPQTTASASTNLQGSNGAFPADVAAFAAAHQAEHCLQPLLDATRRLFPTANFIKVYVQEDPELRDNTQIIFDVQVVGLSLEEARAADDQWSEELLRIYPPLRKILFSLLLDLRR